MALKEKTYFYRLIREQLGFTFIEWTIFIAIIGIILALAYPKINLLLEKFREKQTINNLSLIRSAIAIYHEENDGKWPPKLDVKDKTPVSGFGNYLSKIPKVKVTSPLDPSKSPASARITYATFEDEPSLAKPNTYGKGWRYDGPAQANTGRVWINSSYPDTQGKAYSTY